MRNAYNFAINFVLTHHARQRMKERRIGLALVEVLLSFGRKAAAKDGAIKIFLHNGVRDLPDAIIRVFRRQLAKRPFLIVAEDRIITVGWQSESGAAGRLR